ncbi:PQQ-binding-like beta-propeller repeat protein [Terriglobus albidus]|uniref:PQQ-binding-like beta-propeller repeat protein n=1 Tax=Terriglobus albidus TaxID=1592106 RepID=UPI001C9D26BB|nr:PQQ-binding-like beta-propeller repeat protein [Terriglobus albidus]
MKRSSVTLLGGALFLLCSAGWAVNFLTEGVDNGRTGWLQGDKSFTPQNVKGMKLLWKTKLDSTPREMHNLFAPLLLENVETPSGKKEVAVVAGVTDDLFGLDGKTGDQLWHVHYDTTFTPVPGARGGGTLCPGGQTAVPVATPGDKPGDYTVYAVSWDGRLRTINAADGKDIVPPAKFLPPNGKPYALNLLDGVIYTSVSQGCGGLTFASYAYNLKTKVTSVFYPSGGGLWGRRGVGLSPDGISYMGTGDGEWDVENGHLGNGIIGVKLNKSEDLELVDYFAPKNADWMWKRDLDVNVSPVAIDYKGKHLLLGSSKECRVWLLDRDNFGGDDHRQVLADTPLLCNVEANFAGEGVWGALSTWQDAQGTWWLAVPFYGPVAPKFHAPVEYGRPKHGGIATFKITEKDGKWSLVPVWMSEDMDLAEEAIIANGVMLAYASGEDARQSLPDAAWNEPKITTSGFGPLLGSPDRIKGSRHATLYALDAATGKALWSSGEQISNWNHFTGISAANGRVYIPTFDGNLYCFGVAQ